MRDHNDGYQLMNGSAIPCIGYGTFQTPNEETCAAVLDAIKVGYRHIDTAAVYGNEEGVGAAIRQCGVKREEFFITSKLWNAERGYEKTMAAFDETMKKLGLDYLDLYLIHWPANRKQFGDAAKELNADTWSALEDLYMAGRIKAIGVSNFLPHHLEELLETARIKPMVNQIEFHPGWAQLEAAEYCQKLGMVVEAWSPLGHKAVLQNETLQELAEKYSKSTAQLCVRWVLQHGLLPLPKSVNPGRMQQNLEVFDFEIDERDMQTIDALQNIGGECAKPDEVDF